MDKQTNSTETPTPAKETWKKPEITELDVRSTENNIGNGPDGGAGGLNAS